MKLADGIRKHGFRKWYERELLQSHGHLVLTLACSIGLLAAVEGLFTFDGLADKLLDLLSIALCAGIGLWALRSYLRLLAQAELAASQATCPQCDAYGRFALEQESAPQQLRVRCRKCGHSWHISH